MLILSITLLSNYFCILCYFSLYAFYNKVLIILLCVWNNLCALIYLLYATCPFFYNCYITIHVVHVQGSRCMTNSNSYFVVSNSFVLHTNNIIIIYSIPIFMMYYCIFIELQML